MSSSGGGGNFKVAVRVRPKIDREKREAALECVSVEVIQKAVIITKIESKKRNSSIGIDDFTEHLRNDNPQSQNFFFDLVFGPSATQMDIYDSCVKHIVMSVLEGYNGSIIAYGQTGTGKSYTIEGGNDESTKGVIPRASEEIFTYIKTTASIRDQFLVHVSFLEIYNERLTDLLNPTQENLRIREDGSGGCYVEGLKEHVVRSTEDIKKLISDGAAKRKTAATRMNVESSRSHAVFTIVVEHAVYSKDGGRTVTIGKLRLVDLAGSEKIDSDAKVQQQTETKNINLSLHTFGMVVMALTSTTSSQYIPYRDSKLTRILQDSLGGNCKTSLITTITPVVSCYIESLNSLQFAKRAKHVKNKAIINKDVSQKALMSAYQDEIRRLKEQLERQLGGGGGTQEDEEKLEKLEKAEQEKAEVMSELAKHKQLYKQAEEEKRHLLMEIKKLEKMFLQGGGHDDSEELQKTIKEEREKIKNEAELEYQAKLAELEKERKKIADEKEELARQKEYIAKIRSDFKPDGGTEDIKTGSTDRLFHRVGSPSRLPSRPQPTGSSLPHPPTTPYTISSGAPLPRRLPHTIRSSLPNPPMLPRQPWTSPSYMSGPSSLYAQSINDSLKVYASALSDPTTGIPAQEQQSGIRICTGHDAAQWFTKNMEGVSTIQDAETIGQRLLQIGLLSEIQGSEKFVARKDSYYQFSEPNLMNTPFASRPSSAASLMTLHGTGYQQQFPPQQQYRTGSLPSVYSSPMHAWGSNGSNTHLQSASLTTLNTLSSTELLEQYQLNHLDSTPLHHAAIANDRQKVKDLAQVLPVDDKDNDGNTPLMYAAIAGHSKCCTLLVKQLGANVEAINNSGRTPLMLAVMNEHNSAVKSLLKLGADTSKFDNNKETVFHIGARSSQSKILETLFKYSSDTRAINERNNSIESPLHVAVLSDKPHNIAALLKGNGDIGASDTDGRTALHYAVQCESVQCIQAITQCYPNGINLVDLEGCSGLHLACQNKLLRSVNVLLASNRCDINLTDKSGMTPLHYAVLSNSPGIIGSLLDNGADINIRDNNKMTPLQYSREKKLDKCTSLLVKHK